MLVRKQKGKIMVLNKEEGNEIESYTLLHLSTAEAEALLKEMGLDFTGIVARYHYEYNDNVDTLFKKFADEHKANNPNFFRGKVTKPSSNIYKGKYCLIRNPDQHTIRIVKRTEEDNYNAINHICLDDERARMFFRDCVRNKTFKKGNRKWYLSLHKNIVDYNYWSNYMDKAFLRG